MATKGFVQRKMQVIIKSKYRVQKTEIKQNYLEQIYSCIWRGDKEKNRVFLHGPDKIVAIVIF